MPRSPATARSSSAARAGIAGRAKDKRLAIAMMKGSGRLDRRFGERGFAVVKRGAAALGLTVDGRGGIARFRVA